MTPSVLGPSIFPFFFRSSSFEVPARKKKGGGGRPTGPPTTEPLAPRFPSERHEDSCTMSSLDIGDVVSENKMSNLLVDMVVDAVGKVP